MPEVPIRLAHAVHSGFQKTSTAAATCKETAAPSQVLDVESPEVLEKLEYLDDLVFEALNGQTTALEELQVSWPRILSELGESMVAESRAQYLRYALLIWDGNATPDDIRDPLRALQRRTRCAFCLMTRRICKTPGLVR